MKERDDESGELLNKVAAMADCTMLLELIEPTSPSVLSESDTSIVNELHALARQRVCVSFFLSLLICFL